VRQAKWAAVVALVACSAPSGPQPRPPLPTVRDAGVVDGGAVPRAVDAGGLVIPIDARVVPIDAPPIPPDAAPPVPVPISHPRIYLGPNRARLVATLGAKTIAATRFLATVEKWMAGGDVYNFQTWHAALVGQLLGSDRHCTKSVAVIEAQVKAAEGKIASGAVPLVAGDSYLEIGEMIGDVAIIYDWCHAQTTPAQRTRWIAYANQAVWNVWNHKQATWGGRSYPWTGWSVDNPSNNYYYSFLRATMLLGIATERENDQAPGWLAIYRAKMAALATVFSRDLQGGGSREGTGYGVAMRRLFELYSWWQASTGERLADRTDHARGSLRTMLHQVMPTLNRFAPVGDQSRDSTAMLFDYHRHYLLELTALYPSDPAAGWARQLLASSTVPRMANGFMHVYDFLLDGLGAAPAPLDTIPLAHHAVGIGGIYARSSWTATGATWLGLQSGPYTESHAHQDQGSILLYDGEWLVGDAVVYSHSGLPQMPTAHSMVRIDVGGSPLRQLASTTSRTTVVRSGSGWHYFATDSTPAYGGNANVQLVQRDVLFLHEGVLVVYDRIRTSPTATQTWQLITTARPVIVGAVATAGRLAVHRVSALGAWTVRDLKAENSDYSGGYRLELAGPGGQSTVVTVLSIDGAATSVAAVVDGATMTVGGQPVRVVFDPLRPGGVVSIGAVISVVPEGVTALVR
jgi:hypothetical protein